MGCGCAGVERAALTIAAAGAGAKILGPQGNNAVYCRGAALTLLGANLANGTAYECVLDGAPIPATEHTAFEPLAYSGLESPFDQCFRNVFSTV